MKLTTRLFSLALLAITPIFTAQLSTLSQENQPSPSTGFSVKNMDLSVEPKKNFYQFSTGNWLKKAVISDDKVALDSFSELIDQNNQGSTRPVR